MYKPKEWPVLNPRYFPKTEGKEIWNLRSYFLVSKIGKGHDLLVYKTKYREKVELALKVINNNRNLQNELLAVNWLTISHNLDQWFVPYLAHMVHGNTRYLVQELCRGTLADVNMPVEWSKAKMILAEIAVGIELMHERQMTHNDIKPANLGIDQKGHIKILDLGLYRDMPYPHTDLDETVEHRPGGTREYVAPEICAKMPSTYNVDVFSFGVLAYNMLIGSDFKAQEYNEHTKDPEIQIKLANHRANASNLQIVDMLQRCTDPDPRQRIRTFMDVRRHSVFDDINWKDVFMRTNPPPLPDVRRQDLSVVLDNIPVQPSEIEILYLHPNMHLHDKKKE